MKKIFITDYDGTLFTNEESLKENIKWLKKLQKIGFLINISTGRSYPSIKEQINLYQIPCDLITCADGSITFDSEGYLIKCFPIDNNIIEPFAKFYQNLDYDEIQFSYPEGYLNTLSETNNNLLGINVCINTRNYNKRLVKSFYKMKKKMPNYNYLAYSHPNYSYLCVKPVDISKSFAASYLQKLYDIKKEDIYVIGDSSNDLELIHDFNGACMTSSYDDILKICKKRYNEVSDYINEILKEKN